MRVLILTPRGEKLGMTGLRLPISAFSKLVGTLQTCQSYQMCHIDIYPDNMLVVKMKPGGSYSVLLNDWGI